MADFTPGTARTAASAALRTGSHCGTTPASTVIEKNTLPSLATTSESLPVPVIGVPSGLLTAASAFSTSSLVAMRFPFASPLDKPLAGAVNVQIGPRPKAVDCKRAPSGKKAGAILAVRGGG